MAGTDNEVRMMMSVYPGAMTGFAALNDGLVSINNVFGSMTRSIDAQFGLINTAIITTGVVIGQLGLDAMEAFGKFEQGMKIVQMVSGQTTQEINYLKQQANELSVSYRTDIDQLTEGLQTLGRAGLNSASEQTEVLKNGLNTAKLEGRDLNGVLEELIQNTALLGGNLKSNDFGEQSQYVNDLLVATSMTAPITTHDVSETLKYSGGIAAAAGANIESESGKEILEDYMGAIAAFAQKGVTGSIAGTALRAFFNKPATQDSSVTEALASIHLKPEYLWEDDENTMKPVSEQIAIIKNQMEDLNISTMDQLQIWSKIVGGKMGQQMMKLDSDDIKSLTKDIRDADDATNLAQKSMRTYESNVKAIGEAGERMKRNVGEDLVTIVNPYLTIFSKILEFANNDAMSWPITLTILAVIVEAGRRIKSVISMLKAEIGTLWADFRQGLNYFTQKGGVVRKGDNPIKEDKSGSSEKSSSGGTKKEFVPTTAKALSKHFLEQTSQSGAFTIKAFEQAGLKQSQMALAGHLMSLSSSKNSLGIPEGQLWATALKNNLLSESQYNQMFKAYTSGVNARPTADLVGIESVIPQIKACENALKDLGITASKTSQDGAKSISVEEEKAAMERFGAEAVRETKDNITQEEVFRDALNKEILESNAMIEEQVFLEGEFESAIRRESQAATEATARTTIMADEVIADFMRMTSAVSASVSHMATNVPRPKTTDVYNMLYGKNREMPGYINTTSFFGNITGTGKDITPLYKEWIRSGLGKAF